MNNSVLSTKECVHQSEERCGFHPDRGTLFWVLWSTRVYMCLWTWRRHSGASLGVCCLGCFGVRVIRSIAAPCLVPQRAWPSFPVMVGVGLHQSCPSSLILFIILKHRVEGLVVSVSVSAVGFIEQQLSAHESLRPPSPTPVNSSLIILDFRFLCAWCSWSTLGVWLGCLLIPPSEVVCARPSGAPGGGGWETAVPWPRPFWTFSQSDHAVLNLLYVLNWQRLFM